MNNIEDQLDTFLQSNLDGFIQETAELCAQPSVSAKNEGVRECADLVVRMLERHGFQVQKFETPGNPVIVGHAGGKSAGSMLLYNHYDVQPPEPLELWTTPPFQPSLRDGALYARGASDDKGEFIARLAAVEALRQAHSGELPCSLTFVLEGEEEIGSPHIARFVQEHTGLLKCDAAIWEGGGIDAQGHPGMTLGCRGVLSVELSVETLKMDAHSGNAHILPNAAWRLIQALNCLKGPDEHILIPGLYECALPPSALDLELIEALPDSEGWIERQGAGPGRVQPHVEYRRADRWLSGRRHEDGHPEARQRQDRHPAGT
jgi:acetylornithine deacetylase/succinyl-diaminopimelate desuccinylase-like protein